VTRCKKAGLVFMGRSASPEFGLNPNTEPRLYGSCHNPWNLEYSPGGSSGGAAAAVASAQSRAPRALSLGPAPGGARQPDKGSLLRGLPLDRASYLQAVYTLWESGGTAHQLVARENLPSVKLLTSNRQMAAQYIRQPNFTHNTNPEGDTS
jgi:hypothetical protein